MYTESGERWVHDHTFGPERPLDPDSYFGLLPANLGLVPEMFETHRCAVHAPGAP